MTKDEITVDNFLKGEDIFQPAKLHQGQTYLYSITIKKRFLKSTVKFGEFQIFENFRFLRISDF